MIVRPGRSGGNFAGRRGDALTGVPQRGTAVKPGRCFQIPGSHPRSSSPGSGCWRAVCASVFIVFVKTGGWRFFQNARWNQAPAQAGAMRGEGEETREHFGRLRHSPKRTRELLMYVYRPGGIALLTLPTAAHSPCTTAQVSAPLRSAGRGSRGFATD